VLLITYWNLEASPNQLWKPTREHKFPITFPVLPASAEQIKKEWTAQKEEEGPSLLSVYLNQLALDTNQLDGVFLITDEVGTASFKILYGFSC